MDPRRSTRLNARDESGNIIVLFSVLLPIFVLVMAIVIDVGYWWVNAKKAQTAADACALAAAQSIPVVDPTSGSHDDPDTPAFEPSTGECIIQGAGPDYVLNNLTQYEDSSADPWAGTVVEWPYSKPEPDDDTKVEATVYLKIEPFFSGLVGFDSVSIKRRAVAEQFNEPGTMAIYTNSQDCDPDESLQFGGQNMHIVGWIHTEGGLYVSVSSSAEPQPNFTADRGTMAFNPPSAPTQTRCEESINPYNQVADFVPESVDYLPEGTAPIEWPVWYTPSQFGFYQDPVGTPSTTRCRYKGDDISIKNSEVLVSGGSFAGSYSYTGSVIPSGIYCATKSFKIETTSPRTGSITALAQQITINPTANTLDVTAFTGNPDPVLFFTVPNVTTTTADDGPTPFDKSIHCKNFGGSPNYPGDELKLNSNGMKWDGLIFHPCGRVLIDQSSSTGRGSIVSDRLYVNGGGFNFTGRSNFSAKIHIALVE